MLYQVQRLLGHSSPRVTEIYAHLQNGEMHDVVNKLVVQRVTLKFVKEESQMALLDDTNEYV